MIQVNLIPDLKAEYLKAQRTKRFVISIASVVSAVFVGLVVLMFLYVNVAQQEHTNNLAEDIATRVKDYQSVEDIDKVITIQKQLEELPALHANKPLVSRLVAYLGVVPENVELRSVDLNFDTGEMSIAGTATKVSDVNIFADTVKNAVYTIGEDSEEAPAFENVKLDAINAKADSTIFELIFDFDPQIFTNPDDVDLQIPKIDSTSSEVESPSENRDTQLFDEEEQE